MTRFLRTADCDLVNAAEIVKLISPEKKHDAVIAVMRDGTRVGLIETSVDEIERQLSPVVAAQAGFWVLGFLPEDKSAWREPILAWRIIDTFAQPITHDPELTMEVGGQRVILCPDGRIVQTDGAEYDTEAEWLRVKVGELEKKDRA